MNIRHAMLGAMLVLTTAAFADVDWMILPKYSSSGRMLVHGARYGVSRDGKQPVRLVPKLRFGTPETDKAAKYRYLRCSICGVNEKGLTVLWSSGNPTRDKNPKKKSGVYTFSVAMTAMLRANSNCTSPSVAPTTLRMASSRQRRCTSSRT